MTEPEPLPKRVVWVLGAGFSRALGGPLLPDLLSRTSAGDLAVRFPKKPTLHDDVADVVRSLYHFGRKWPEGTFYRRGLPFGSVPGELLWQNAEDFLDYIDTAAAAETADESNPHAERLLRLLGDAVFGMGNLSLKDLVTRARHLVAAECCGFLVKVSTDREQWEPFRTWEASLGAGDTLITFNYDRVVEMLGDAHDKRAQRLALPRGSVVKVIRPGFADDMREARLAGCCPFLKLHGSVDWRLASESPARIEIMHDPMFATDCPDGYLAIATPGPSKSRTAKSFRDIWEFATKALQEADAVVFVGYRFPETDAHARETLLSAIRENNAGKYPHHLSLHIVLGGHAEHTARLTALLSHVCRASARSESKPKESVRTFRVNPHPLFAQDFFTVARRDEL